MLNEATVALRDAKKVKVRLSFFFRRLLRNVLDRLVVSVVCHIEK